jgi:hypothetical protein
MSEATLTFTLPEESHEFKAASNAGDLQSAIQDLDGELRRRAKYGKPSEQRLTATQARELLRLALDDHDAGWALE